MNAHDDKVFETMIYTNVFFIVLESLLQFSDTFFICYSMHVQLSMPDVSSFHQCHPCAC